MRVGQFMILFCDVFFIALLAKYDYYYNRNELLEKQSLYHQRCCLPDNQGQIIKITDEDVYHFIICPSEIPTFCQKMKISRSCSDVLTNNPNSTGYYKITLTNGSTVSVYCDMEGVNCDGEGGWMRIGYINMTEPNATCPSGLTQQHYGEISHPLCGRESDGCDSTYYSSFGINYTKVCGQVQGYQYKSTDGFGTGIHALNYYYVDGISITRGFPRHHVWTYAAGNSVYYSDSLDCPCNNGSSATVPSFVGGDYYCESGFGVFGLRATDPLWDGEQCNGLESTCCQDPEMPWFYKELQETSEDIELRVCASSDRLEEESPIDIFELFCK